MARLAENVLADKSSYYYGMVNRAIDEAIRLAEQQFNIKITYPKVTYFRRGRTAGTYSMSSHEVRLNEVLLFENGETFIETVFHEMAHLVQHIVYPQDFETSYNRYTGRRSKRDVHGSNFKYIMNLFGYRGDTYHSMDTSSVAKKTREWVWVSKNDPSITMTLGTKRHNKMKSGRTKYFPKGCGHHEFVFSHEKKNDVIRKTISKPTAPKRPRAKTKVSKMDICRGIMNSTPVRDRKWYIEQFMTVAGCTDKGASTYFQKLKKEFKL